VRIQFRVRRGCEAGIGRYPGERAAARARMERGHLPGLAVVMPEAPVHMVDA